MADSNQARLAEKPRHLDDDPFAELTRIMGFDPRVPARPAAPKAVSAPAMDVSDDDVDFSIDLEKELMGEFADEFAPETDVHADPEFDADLSLEAELQAEFESVGPQYAAPASHSEPALRQPFFRVVDDRETQDDQFPQDSFATAASDRYVHEAPAEELPAMEAELDDALAASFDTDFAAEEPGWSAHRDDAQPAHGAVDMQPRPLLPQSDPFSADFDTAMAEVDMDFDVQHGQPALQVADPIDDFDLDLDDHADDRYEAAPSVAAVADDRDDGLLDDLPEFVAQDSGPVSYAAATDEAADYQPVQYDRARYQDESDEPGYETQPSDAARQPDIAPIDDAIAELTAMMRTFETPEQTRAAAPAERMSRYAGGRAEVPDIETVDVPESAVALADDLEIPEVDYADQQPTYAFDDLDAELATAFSELETDMAAQAPDPVSAGSASPYLTRGRRHEAQRYEEPQLRGFETAAPVVAAGAACAAAPGGQAYAQQQAYYHPQDEFDAPSQPAAESRARDQQFDDDDFDFTGELGADALAVEPYEAEQPVRRNPNRGLLIAAVVGGVAFLGAVGAMALSMGGGSGSGEPAVVKADATPVKVRPENPGGTTVPNQDNKVYEKVARSNASDSPVQEKLISSAEEPLEVPMPADDPVADDVEGAIMDDQPAMEADSEAVGTVTTPKGEDRIEQIVSNDGARAAPELAAVTPRRVRTMVVKPDGTLVPREEIAPEAEATGALPADQPESAVASLTEPELSAPAAEQEIVPADQPEAVEMAPAVGEQAPSAVAEEPAEPAVVQPPVAAKNKPAVKSNAAHAVPASRPADQPVDIVGEVKPDQVAAVAPNAPVVAGSWSMQIASQPSQESARSTYRDLARRYSSVLAGREPSIVKAEIAGKGTFWRVRVPAGSRNEAISLCESYKAVGGNCFVSK